MKIPQYGTEYSGLLEKMIQDLFDNDTPANGLHGADRNGAENDTAAIVKAQKQIPRPINLSGKDYETPSEFDA